MQTVRIAPNQITEWKRQLLESTVNVFGGITGQDAPVDLAPLHAKIAHLTLENELF